MSVGHCSGSQDRRLMYIYYVFRTVSSTAPIHVGSFTKLQRVGVVNADSSVAACDIIREHHGDDGNLVAWLVKPFNG